ncbi:hypothetical protein VIN01S_35060 [Vibrio inusitatus NBRC 102082]|uniref:Outer membrane protein beta-barrel domain-containing protein n=1 Tax=Vibrio inusitatus NBRC 102082 TaxID=1219070 RepID=A0A4Y3I1H6_9VIBR|nr:hypothetical protein [Vibrio inusitatus]GEA52702.1 hypothetical protein VIN01S_35060 [Vibrio inusitatus NBRC 102082]
MKTKVITLSSLLFLSLSVQANEEQTTEVETAQSKTEGHHAQDVRNVQTKLEADYFTHDHFDGYAVGGDFGITDKASIGVTYTALDYTWNDRLGRENSSDSDMIALTGQYNINENIVIDALWNVSGDYDQLTFGGNYVSDASFGVWNIGANYSMGDYNDSFDFEAGVLIPFGDFYYRGDFTYYLDAGYDTEFENKIGWTNGSIDVNASFNMYEFDDSYVGIHFGYLF